MKKDVLNKMPTFFYYKSSKKELHKQLFYFNLVMIAMR